MFIHEISIAINSKYKKVELLDIFGGLLSLFSQNGQITQHDTIPSIQDNCIKATIATLEKDAFDQKYNNNLVEEDLNKLEKLCNATLQTKIIGTSYPGYKGCCKCKKHDFLILFTHLFNRVSPIDCGNCFMPISFYKLKIKDVYFFECVMWWERNYRACDTLQISCRTGEKWAMRQMSDYKSELSQLGIEICEKITELTKIPTYYYLFNYRQIPIKKDKKRPCPSCGGEWLLEKPLHRYDFKCDACRLISTITSNGY